MNLITFALAILIGVQAQKKCPGTAKHIEHYANGYIEKLICDNLVDNGCPKELPPPANVCKFFRTSEYNGKTIYDYSCNSYDQGTLYINDLKGKGWKCVRIRLQ